jgi:hypothetical protein
MIPLWLLTILHYASLVSAVLMLGLLAWHAWNAQNAEDENPDCSETAD